MLRDAADAAAGAQVRELPKTMLAAKSFERTGSPAAIARWLRILAEELAERLAVDGAEHARRPRSLSVTYRRAAGARGAALELAWPRSRARAELRGGEQMDLVTLLCTLDTSVFGATAPAVAPPALALRRLSRAAWRMGA